MRQLATRWNAALMAVLLVLALAGCGTRRPMDAPVTVRGMSGDPLVQRTFNTIWNVETPLLIAGEALVAAREAGKITDARWNDIADASDKFHNGLEELKLVLVDYQLSGAPEAATAVEKAMAILVTAARTLQRRSAQNGVVVEVNYD